jgi:hypothetical protein
MSPRFPSIQFLTLILLAIVIPQIVLAEDIYFKVIETTPTWEERDSPRWFNISGEIPEGAIVKGYRGIRFSYDSLFEGIPLQGILYNNKSLLIYANSIIPLDTRDLFEENLLYNPEKPMIFSFYMDALLADNREIIYLHDKREWDEQMVIINEDLRPYVKKWWEHAYILEDLIITQTSITLDPIINYYILDKTKLLIKNIEKTENGYLVTVKKEDVFLDTYFGHPIFDEFGNVVYPDEPEFTISIIPDGDYIDIELYPGGGIPRYIFTFVSVNKECITQLNNLIKGRPVDLTRVALPRRADSADYLPRSNFTATHRTIPNVLPLWDTVDDDSADPVINLPKGTRVRVIETGPVITVEGISAPWVKVISGNGSTGWCFSGGLEEIEKPDIVNNLDVASASTGESQTDEVAQSNEEPRSLPLWALIAIISGAVVAVAVVVLFMAKREK